MREIKFREFVDGKIRHFVIGQQVRSGIVGLQNLPIMQFTGLKDKNEKEIYEGDIIMSAINYKSFGNEVVEWDDSGGYTFFSDGEYGINPKICKIVGNIYENPELLN